MRPAKPLIVIVLLLCAIAISYSIPKAKYVGTGFISQLNVPESIGGWKGRDVTTKVGLNVNASSYEFISEALAYQYVNREGSSLIFMVLDAGNFHHPKNCFISAGYKIKELPDTRFNLPGRDLKAHTLYTERGGESFLSFYWIVIDKNIAHEWIEQKFKQLYFSLFGKKRVGLMVRVDIPAKETDIEAATIMAKNFIGDLDRDFSPKQADYIFGEK